jgi:plasmid stabilization system protein ParE
VNVVLRPAARADLDQAFGWYELQRRGLGAEFLEAIDETIRSMGAAPRRYGTVHRDIRRAHVRRFPYRVFYRVLGDDIVVLACIHGSRSPGAWMFRR